MQLIWPRDSSRGTGERVQLAAGVEAPAYIPPCAIRREEGDELPYDLEMSVRYRAGRYVVDHLACLRVEGGRPVDSAGLRLVPVTNLVAAVVANFVWDVEPSEGGPQWTEFLNVAPADAAAGPTDDALRKAAIVYAVAYACGLPPTKTVMTNLGLARSTAGRWVTLARERGFLGPTTPGRAGEHG